MSLLSLLFSNPNLLKDHIPEFSIHSIQKITFPEPKNNEDVDFDILRFKNIRRTLPVPLRFIATSNLLYFRFKMMIQHLIQMLVISINPVILPVFV